MSLMLVSFPRSGVEMHPATLQRCQTRRWSVLSGVPTPERGNDETAFKL